jgi:hypothetical protein
MANMCLNLIQLRGPRAALLPVLAAGTDLPAIRRATASPATLTDRGDALVLELESRWTPTPEVALAMSRRYPDLTIEYVYSEVCWPYCGCAVYRGGRKVLDRFFQPGIPFGPDELAAFPAIAGIRYELEGGDRSDSPCATLYFLEAKASDADQEGRDSQLDPDAERWTATAQDRRAGAAPATDHVGPGQHWPSYVATRLILRPLVGVLRRRIGVRS